MAEIPKAYEPQAVEAKWYQYWLSTGCFTANPRSTKPAYSIVIPPPNVTGVLHMGHVLNNTIQDILSRRARMMGKEVLWLPGTDHAGIATQAVVEKNLRKQGIMKHRDDLGREKFLEYVWAWKEKHGGIIIEQLKKLGCSCDWTRERFTMDSAYSKCVQKVFVELYRKGLIYRGKRMVNWDPAARTALSDEEVEWIEEKGHLWHIKYPVLDEAGHPTSDEFVVVATTRPETMLGDEAVAVHPQDERYFHLHGKKLLLPLQNKPIPIITDELVDPKFGTGCVKVTPAHDPADYEMAVRHNLPFTVVIGPDGTMTSAAGEDFAGMDRMEARQAVIEELTELGLLLKTEDYVHNVGYSQRSHVPIEPYLSEQWFLKYPSVEPSLKVVEEGRLKFHPDRWVKTYTHWMRNLKDWCISRQLWWGHRVPVWYNRRGKAALEKELTVVCLSDRELSGASARELRRAAWDWAKAKGILKNHFCNLDTGWSIYVNRRSLEHAFSHTGLANILMLPALPDLLKHAIHVATEAHRPPLPQCRWVHKFLALLQMGNQLYRIRFTVKEFADGRKLYDHHAVTLLQTNGADGNSPGTHPLAEMLVTQPSSARTVKLRDLVLDVNAEPTLCRCQIESPGPDWEQDPDVLDTWFSSWLWPFATMGWPEKTETLQKFYPTTDLVTGPDIIFFWVARMIMAGYEFMGEMPFRNVYFTGIIRDKLGRKMSKSLGNSPEPLELIARYGADALRFGTMRGAPLGQDVLFDEKDVELGRNFCNKLWNACRFRQMQGGESEGEIDPALLSSDDIWILLRLDTAIREVSAALDEYHFNEAANVLYRFFWNEYCDWYIEASKAVLQGADAARKANTLAVIDFVLSHTLRLFHPFLPFITEELWHGMGFNHDLPEGQGGKTIMFAPWPKPLDEDFKAHYCLLPEKAAFTENKYELVRQGRNLKREANIAPTKKVQFILKPAVEIPDEEAAVIKLLLNAQEFTVQPGYEPPKGTPSARTPLGDLYLPLAGAVDVEAEKARLQKELDKIQREIDKIQEKLNNPQFVQKVPPPILAEQQRRLAEWEAKRQKAAEALQLLNG